jgi:hypothetical protein
MRYLILSIWAAAVAVAASEYTSALLDVTTSLFPS